MAPYEAISTFYWYFSTVYIDIGSSQDNDIVGFAASLQITYDQVVGSRSFNIRVSQLDCTSKENPPAGCLQYLTGTQGNLNLVKMYRYRNPKNNT